jgi:GTP pyrophosphokinase
VEVSVQATDRQGLLRDISEVFAKEKMNVVGVQSQSVKGATWMTFTVEVADASLLKRVMQTVSSVPGVALVKRN